MVDSGMRTIISVLPERPNNKYDLPANILAVVCGPSMCGKTTYVLNLVMNDVTGGKFIKNTSTPEPDEIHIFAPTIGQVLYQKCFALKENNPDMCANIKVYKTLDKLSDH
jgi:ABC-type proline/glycine betaine transport system ATPase subunit